MIARILLALDESTLQKQLKTRLSHTDVIVAVPKNRRNLWSRVNRETCDLVVVSLAYIPEPPLEMISEFCELPDTPTLVIISRENDPEERAGLLAAGAEEVLYAGLTTTQLLDVLTTVLDKRLFQIQQTLNVIQPLEQPRLNDFISNSPIMQDFMDMVRRVVPSNTSLLVQGETGVGKERLARAIHAEGPRSEGPFIAINCGALPESLLESELFGHEEGAFTGATRSRRGCFEMAHNGIIFLDEIGEMPTHVQVRLLRVLQEHEVQRIGGERTIKVDVRVMAATNRDLQLDVAEKSFRKDLFYRLSVVALTVPPLRERIEDIRELTSSYLDYLRPRVGREVLYIDDDAVEAMEQYDWPGNVRELINVIERAMLLCSGETITRSDLPDTMAAELTSAEQFEELPPSLEGFSMPSSWLDLSLSEVKKQVLEGIESAYLDSLLSTTQGKVGETARRADITPRSLYSKMKEHNLKKEDYKN